MKLKLSNHLLNVSFKRLIKDVIGIGSQTLDGYHTPFFDFDNFTYKKTRNTMMKTQKQFGLSKAIIFESSKNNYHAMTMDKLTFGQIIDIHRNIKNYDRKHDIHSMIRGYWVLRISPKQNSHIKFKTILPNRSYTFDKSNAHRIFLNNFYHLKLKKNRRYDEFYQVMFDRYATVKKKS